MKCRHKYALLVIVVIFLHFLPGKLQIFRDNIKVYFNRDSMKGTVVSGHLRILSMYHY